METSVPEKQNHMPLGRLCAEAGVPCPTDIGQTDILGVTADSRRVRPGWLFIAVDGRRTDGRKYIPDALAAGAAAVIYSTGGCTPEPSISVPQEGICLPTAHIRRVMANLFDAWYGHPGRRLRLVGITGTNGKTTVACMLYHLLQAAGRPCGLIGTLGAMTPQGSINIRPADAQAAMTTPDPEELYAILNRMAEAGAGQGLPTTVVMEVSSHALAWEKVSPLAFDLAIFTNLSPEHLDFHGTLENYFEAKQALFDRARRAVINADDRYARLLPAGGFPVEKWWLCRMAPGTMASEIPCPDSTCDRCQGGQIRSLGLGGVEYRLSTPDVRLRLSCPVPGEFTVMNSMQAAVAALALGISPGCVKEGLAGFPGVPGRLERVPLPGTGGFGDSGFSVFIDFAHTPDALEHLLLTFHRLRETSGRRTMGRIVLLFGCGGDRDRSKRKTMAHIASRMSDVTVITSDNSRSEDPQAIIGDILAGIDRESEYVVIPDRAEAIRHVIRCARPGDVILLCGKGHETYEIDRTGRHPFCERDIVCRAWDEVRGIH